MFIGVTNVSCSNTHNAAWHTTTHDVFTWGCAGSWLGLGDDQERTFGKVAFDEKIVNSDKQTVKVECGHSYSMVLFHDGKVAAFGINEHGRMGLGAEVSETWFPKLLQSNRVPAFADISAGTLHTGFLTFDGQVYTCGIGEGYRLGHGNEHTMYVPQHVEMLRDCKIVRIECVDNRTYCITDWGCVLMWGVDPVTELLHKSPFVYEYMRPYRIYLVKAAKDFTMALGVHSKEPVPKPEFAGGVLFCAAVYLCLCVQFCVCL